MLSTSGTQELLHKPLTSHGEYVINVSSNGSVSAGAGAMSSTSSNP